MSTDPTKRYDGRSLHEGGTRSAPYPTSRLAPPVELVDLARRVADADQSLLTHTSGKLRVIAAQIQALQDQARGILEQARRDQDLHRVPCSFRRTPGKVYHLYRRPDGSRYFSMLDPAEWSAGSPDTHEGSWRLEADQSWTPVEEAAADDPTERAVQQLLDQVGLALPEPGGR